jgi:hypothetical protein
MRFFIASCFVWIGVVFSGPALSKAPEIAYGPAPAWILPMEAAKLTPEMEEESGGSIYLLVDTQISGDREHSQYYFRKVVKTTNSSGVADVSDIDITIDPAWQKLVLHHLKVIRDGKVIDQTREAEIDMARLERDLDRRIYNGQWTALIRLADVRPGDVIDTAWSWEGRNPVFGSHDFGSIDLAWGIPVERRHVRLDWPSEMLRNWQAKNTPIEPVVESFGKRTVISFGPYRAAELDIETGSPKWVSQQPSFDFSSFDSWADVAKWAAPLYQVQIPDSITEVANRIRTEHQSRSDQLLAALHFAQEEVRYLSISIGEGGYIPRSPEVTLQKRFGDCKDKTMLFVSLARELGFEAKPALADLETGRALADRLPAPGAFDHVIAEVQFEGKTYWLDATANGQRGDLDGFSQAHYGYALPISQSTTDLAYLAEPDSDPVLTRITETIDISKGVEAPLTLTSVSEFRGPEANRIRSQLAAEGRKSFEQAYLKFYEPFFPGIKYNEPLRVEDDEEANIILVYEELIADHPYTLDEDTDYYTFSYTVHSVPEIIAGDAVRTRKTPLAIVPGIHSTHEIIVLLTNKGKDWDLDPESRSIDNSAFKFDWSARKRRGKWVMKAELQTKEPMAAAKLAPGILDDHNQMRKDVGWGLRVAAKEE